MERFTVPQFIDVEDKIIGPVTTRQFLIVMVSMFFVVGTYALADFSLFVFMAAIELTLGAILAFLRINGRPFHFFILNILQTLKRPSIRVWHKESEPSTVASVMLELHPVTLKKSDDDKMQKVRPEARTLRDLVKVLDTGGQYTGDEI